LSDLFHWFEEEDNIDLNRLNKFESHKIRYNQSVKILNQAKTKANKNGSTGKKTAYNKSVGFQSN